MKVNNDVKRKMVELSESGLSNKEVYEYYKEHDSELSYDSFRRQLVRWKNKFLLDEEILDGGNLKLGFDVHASTVQVDKEGNVIQAWIKGNKNNSLTMNELKEVLKEEVKPVELEEVEPVEESDLMLEIPLFDMHFGLNRFEHYKNTMSKIISILSSKIYNTVVIPIGQDLFHNDDFQGRTTKGTMIQKVDMVQAWKDASKFWFTIIEYALQRSRNVVVVYTKGNHDETVSWCFCQMLGQRYGKNIELISDPNRLTGYRYNDVFIGFSHGSDKRSGSIDLIEQFKAKFKRDISDSTTVELHLGHLHSECEKDYYGTRVRRLSTLNKTDDWHEENGYIGSTKRFLVFEYGKQFLETVHNINQ